MEDDDHDVAKPLHDDPGKRTGWTPRGAARAEVPPGKATLRDVARVDRRADAGADELDHESAGQATAQLLESATTGHSLPHELIERLSRDLGVDLSPLRIHTDDAAARAAATLRARAFTIGNNIYFAAGAYEPGTLDGQALVAHEAAHVAQNILGTTSAAPNRVSNPGDQHEREAEAFADRYRARAGSDPATTGKGARNGASRATSPFRAQLEEHLGVPLDFMDTYTGESAELARRLVEAGAFAVRSIVALADPSPQREKLLHELTHVVQTGGPRAQAASGSREQETERAPRQPVVSPSSGGIHRDKKKSGGDDADAADPKAAFKAFTSKKPGRPVDMSDKREDVRYGVLKGGYLSPRLLQASESFTGAQFAKAVKADQPGIKAGDLKKLYASDGESLKLAKVKGTSDEFVVYADKIDYVSEVDYAEPTKAWKKYKSGVDALKVPSFTWPEQGGTLTEADASYTDNEDGKYRDVMKPAIAALPRFAAGAGHWDKYWTEVVNASPRLFDNRTTGDIFNLIVLKSKYVDKEKKFANPEKGDPIFDVALYGLEGDEEAHGDGTCTYDGKRRVIIEAKAKKKGPSQKELTQAENYAKILLKKGKAYKLNGEQVEKHEFNHVIYTIADDDQKKIVKKWYEKLFVEQPAIFNRQTASIVPPPDGVPRFKFKINPEFEVELGGLDDPRKHFVLDAPALGHPGVDFKKIDVEVDDAKTKLVRGHVIYDLTAGDIEKKNVRADFKPTEGDGGLMATLDGKMKGLKSSLEKVLGPVNVDAAIVDDGVEATLDILTGSAKAIAGFQVDGISLKAKYTTSGELAVSGKVGLRHRNGKISGHVELGWSAGQWTFNGDLTVSEGMIPGVSEFTTSVAYENGNAVIEVDQIKIEKKFSAITLTGTGRRLKYDTKKGAFSGEATLSADLGAFGTASADATIENNDLKKATLDYDSPEFTYPAKSDKPAFKGTVGGTITYDSGKFSGDVRGTANIVMPALQKIAGEKGIGLAVDGHIDQGGGFSGTVKSTNPLKFGKYLEIPSLSCTFAKDGSLSGDFAIKVVNIKHLEKAEIACTVNKDGITIKKAGVTVTFGDQAKGSFWGSLTAGYTEEKGLDIGGTINYKIKDDMIAVGTLKYDQATNAVTLEMKVEEITLLDKKMSKTLFKASKQIPVVNVYGLGIYVDIGFDLGFDFGFKLTMTPEVDFIGLSLDTWKFEKIAAKLKIGGDVFAQLTGTPKLGIGVFALDPSIIRGGGGLKVPIVGRLDIKPSGDFGVSYKPDGGVDGSAKLGLAGQFGITGSLKPYAEFSVLNDMWNPSWTGEALASFEILKPKELFNFTVDFAGDNKDLKDGPQLPEENQAQAPREPTGDKTAKPEQGTPEDKGGDANKSQPAKSGEVAEGGDQGPFSLESLLAKFQSNETVATATKIFNWAKKVWNVVKPFYDIIEPIVKLIGQRIEAIIDLFDTEAPTADNIVPWLWKLAKKLWNVAFGGLSDIANAIRTIAGTAIKFAKKLINKAVQEGHIGVKRYSYYIWMPWPKDDIQFMAAAEYKVVIPGVVSLGPDGPPGFLLRPSGAISLVLYEALTDLGIGYSYVGNSDINEPYNDIWYGAGARG